MHKRNIGSAKKFLRKAIKSNGEISSITDFNGVAIRWPC